MNENNFWARHPEAWTYFERRVETGLWNHADRFSARVQQACLTATSPSLDPYRGVVRDLPKTVVAVDPGTKTGVVVVGGPASRYVGLLGARAPHITPGEYVLRITDISAKRGARERTLILVTADVLLYTGAARRQPDPRVTISYIDSPVTLECMRALARAAGLDPDVCGDDDAIGRTVRVSCKGLQKGALEYTSCSYYPYEGP